MNKPYLVTVASRTEGVPRFAESLKWVLPQVDSISVQFKPFIPELPAYKQIDEPYCGNMKRFDHVPKLDEGRFMVFSDTDDVVFQRSLPDFERMNYDVYLANENVKHKDSYWKGFMERNPYFNILSEKTIYNGGLFAMRYGTFKKMMKFYEMHKVWVKTPEDMGSADQMLFNLFFAKTPEYQVYNGLEVFCPLYNNYDNGLLTKNKGLFVLKDGRVPVAVHANGNNKEVLNAGKKANKKT